MTFKKLAGDIAYQINDLLNDGMDCYDALHVINTTYGIGADLAREMYKESYGTYPEDYVQEDMEVM